ncbi:MAG: hypothetical protein FWD28_01740 [Treponema sp.]|nr:hypothetical protein [Treponema sp.]
MFAGKNILYKTSPKPLFCQYLAVFIFCIFITGCTKVITDNFDDYSKRRIDSMYHSYIARQVMPALEDLPEYKEKYYQYRRKIYLFFMAETMLLVVTYNEETYNEEKEKIDNFEYAEGAVLQDGSKWVLLPEHEFWINSFYFRVLAKSKENYFDFPKYMGIIAVSDERKSIAYLYFADQDIDYFTTNEEEGRMVRLINDYFSYNW